MSSNQLILSLDLFGNSSKLECKGDQLGVFALDAGVDWMVFLVQSTFWSYIHALCTKTLKLFLPRNRIYFLLLTLDFWWLVSWNRTMAQRGLTYSHLSRNFGNLCVSKPRLALWGWEAAVSLSGNQPRVSQLPNSRESPAKMNRAVSNLWLTTDARMIHLSQQNHLPACCNIVIYN